MKNNILIFVLVLLLSQASACVTENLQKTKINSLVNNHASQIMLDSTMVGLSK